MSEAMNRNEATWSFISANQIGSKAYLYPDPLKTQLYGSLANWLRLRPENLLITAGGDQLIEIFLLSCLTSGIKTVAIQNPSFGLFQERASLLGLKVVLLQLDQNFKIQSAEWQTLLSDVEALILCTPNNPTGNSFDPEVIRELIEHFPGRVLIDQAYLEFCQNIAEMDCRQLALNRKNAIILRTFSKAWGLAGLRVGYAIGCAEFLNSLAKFLTPYNVSQWSLEGALLSLRFADQMQIKTMQLTERRKQIKDQLETWSCVSRVFPSDANFLLIECRDLAEFEVRLGNDRHRVRKLGSSLPPNMIRLTIDLEFEVRDDE